MKTRDSNQHVGAAASRILLFIAAIAVLVSFYCLYRQRIAEADERVASLERQLTRAAPRVTIPAKDQSPPAPEVHKLRADVNRFRRENDELKAQVLQVAHSNTALVAKPPAIDRVIQAWSTNSTARKLTPTAEDMAVREELLRKEHDLRNWGVAFLAYAEATGFYPTTLAEAAPYLPRDFQAATDFATFEVKVGPGARRRTNGALMFLIEDTKPLRLSNGVKCRARLQHDGVVSFWDE